MLLEALVDAYTKVPKASRDEAFATLTKRLMGRHNGTVFNWRVCQLLLLSYCFDFEVASHNDDSAPTILTQSDNVTTIVQSNAGINSPDHERALSVELTLPVGNVLTA
eukprot:GHVU01126685.1.p1 GENE.GHVU01126685.1~~GHVU01126685.1.p1  ORF type:complete len:108 (+),score=8.12 GHVU01126685.1:286-609(+)